MYSSLNDYTNSYIYTIGGQTQTQAHSQADTYTNPSAPQREIGQNHHTEPDENHTHTNKNLLLHCTKHPTASENLFFTFINLFFKERKKNIILTLSCASILQISIFYPSSL